MKKLVLFLAFVMTMGNFVQARPPIELTDENFEHDTQSATGGTTGDWLVLFCEPNRFRVCKEIMPMWAELSALLAGRVNVAQVDV